MGSSGSTRETTGQDVRRVFSEVTEPGTPLTTGEVADRLECDERTAKETLAELADREAVRTRSIDEVGRVWWRAAAAEPTGEPGMADVADDAESAPTGYAPEEYGAFVSAVEDYAIFTLDPDGVVVTWNEGAERIKGYAAEEIVGEHFSTFYTDEAVAAGVPTANLEAAADEGRTREEGWRVRADGTEFRADVVVTAIRDDDGELRGFTKVTRDMTEQREYEQQLRRERDQTEKLLRTVPVSIAVQDADGETVMANEQAQETLGLSEREFIEDPEDFDEWEVYDENGEPLSPEESPAARVLATGEPVFDQEVVIDPPNDDAIRFTINAAPLFDDEGSMYRVITAGKDVTELKRRERQLERRKTELETELSEVLGRISDAFYALDNEWRFTHLNDRAAEIMQYSREELIGREVWSVFPGADEIYRERFEAAMDGQEPVNFEVRDEERDTWFEFTAYPSASGLSVYFRDVTDRKERERELARFETLFTESTDVNAVLNPDGTFQYLPPSVENVLGYTADELENVDAFQRVHEEDRERVLAEFQAMVEDPDYRPVVEFRYRHADGSWVWLEATGRNMLDDPVIEGLVAYTRDVTDRRERERELRERERSLSRYKEYTDDIIDTVDDVFYVVAADGTLKRWNESLAAVTGYSDEEIASMHVADFFAAEDRQATARAIREGIEDGSVNVELDLRTKDGEAIPYEFAGAPLETPVGETVLAGIGRDVTERKVRERRLEESERRYRTLAEHFPNGAVGVYDRDLRYTLAAGAKLGTDLPSAEELEGSRMPDLFPGHTVADLEPLFRGAIEDGVTDSVTTAFGGRDWRVWAAPLVGADGETFGGLSFAQDVTEEVERKTHLQRFETIVEAVNDGVYVVDADGYFTMVNDAYAEMLGYAPDELVGEHVSTVVEADVRERAEELEKEMAADLGDRPTIEAEMLTKGGERVPAEANFAMLPEGDDAWHRVGVVRDVSERKERERKLERWAHQQAVVADLGQFALETEDLDELMHEAGRVVAEVLDTDYCKVLDLDDEERELLLRQGVGWREGIVGEATVDADENSQAGYTLFSEQPVVVDDLASETRFDGPDLLTSHDVTSGVSTIVGSVDEPWGILGTHDTEVREFTEEDVNFVKSVANVLAEAIERHRYQAELESLVADLEESNERLEQFAYAASHDLQEPLRMVSSYLRLIERRYEEALDEDGREFLEFAVDGADRMRDMIDGLLEYSRVDTRGDPFEPVDLEAVLADTREALRVKIDEHDAEITAGSLPTVAADANQMGQLFQNLLDNAIEYSGDERPRVTVTSERAPGAWRISVHDEGIGMDPEDADRAFEVFQSLHTQAEHDGTGIGLALCERIVERHGGDIWIESDPGEGSTVTFTLPTGGGDDE